MNTTHTKEPTEQKEKLKGGQLLETIDLRDYFAAKAITGFNRGMQDYGWDDKVLNGQAREAYRIADAMIKAREAK